MVFELEGAERMRNELQRVALAVGEVIHRVDAPLVARAVMFLVKNSVEDRVTHVEIGMRHVNLGPEHFFSVAELAIPHPLEKCEAFLGRAVAERAVGSRLLKIAATLANFIGVLIVDIGFTFLD